MKKSSKLFSAILAVMLMVSALGAIPANAVEAEVTVNSLPELEEAIAAAVNGDMIYIATVSYTHLTLPTILRV